ncbi:hypothetical protein B0H14DRAFT_2996508 [Mycena olivaceomarginata]|nr:hypothetical protein B0H14DRAFT_2996508 [Mycena olivaceomarginata]
MTTQAEVHKYKSEYCDAWKIQTEIVQISANKMNQWHALALLNVAEIEVLIGVSKCDVQQKIEFARSMPNLGARLATVCDIVLGDLYLREKALCAAQVLFEKCLRSTLDAEVKSVCLERLGNTSQWGANASMCQWTIIFLTLRVYKALQFFGDTFLHEKDEDTAITLFTVALEAFTYIDVHQSRAECMLRLGDIFKCRGDWLKAVELWTTARPLFERSSQTKEVQCVEERLAYVDHDVLEQQREKTTCLMELHAPARNLSPIQDKEYVALVDELFDQLVV